MPPMHPLRPSMLCRSSIRRQTPRVQSLDRRRHISAYGYTQAKALVYSKHGDPQDVLSLHTHSISPPHSNLLTLRTLAAPLNPADINQIQGTYASLPSLNTDLGTSQPSAVPGNEGVFEVVSAGSRAKGFTKGDWVIPRRTGLGTWRTNLQIPSEKVIKVENKEGLKPIDAATITVNPITAWRMLTDFVKLDAEKGDWFIQNGANSGVGRAALQLGKRWGYKSIAVIRDRPGEEGVQLKKELEELGATQVVTEQETLERDFKDKIKEWTNGGRESLKLALNCVGGKPTLSLAKVLEDGGCVVTYGAMAKQPLTIPASLLIFKNLNFAGFWVSKWGDRNPEEKEKVVNELFDMIKSEEFKQGPVVEVPWNLKTGKEELVQAVQGTLEGFRRGKGVYVFGDE